MHCIRPEKAQAQAQGTGDAELVATDTPSPPASPPMAAGHPGVHPGSVQLGWWGLWERDPRNCV